MKKIKEWPVKGISGAKRANITFNEEGSDWDWFVGYGKDESCQFEGSWYDMVCFARNVLACENTKLVAPEFYKPEWAIRNYTATEEEQGYVYGKKKSAQK